MGGKGKNKQGPKLLEKLAAGQVPLEASNTKYPEDYRELLDDDVRSDLLEYHEDIWTGRFHHSVALGENFGKDKQDLEAYIDQIHEFYASRFAKTILHLAKKPLVHKDWELLIKNAKMKLNIK